MALNTNVDIISEVLVRLNASSTVAFYTDTILNAWENNAYKFVAAYKKWPVTLYMDSSTLFGTNSLNSTGDAYAYPSNFRSESIRWVKDSNPAPSQQMYDKVIFRDYNQYLTDFVGGKDRVFSDFGRTFFINPNIATGTIFVFGQIVPPTQDWTAPTATLFSGGDEEMNEAIVEEMLSYALTREKTPTSFYRGKFVSAAMAQHQKATDLLDAAWAKYQDEEFAYQSKNREMFKRFSVERGALRDDILRRDQFY